MEVLILSNGVTAKRDSVTPAPNPATTVRGPVIFPSASFNKSLYLSKATNPAEGVRISLSRSTGAQFSILTYPGFE